MFTLIMSVFVNGQLVMNNPDLARFDDFETCNNVARMYRAESYPGYGVVALCIPTRGN